MTYSSDRAREAYASARPVLDRILHSGNISLPDVTSAWDAIAGVLHALAPAVSATDANGLVASLRQSGLCTLDEAHAFIDLHVLAQRSGTEPATVSGGDLSRQLIAGATTTLDRVVRTATAATDAAPLHAEYARAAAPAQSQAQSQSNTSGSLYTPASQEAVPASGSTGRSSAFVVGLVVVCLLAAGVAAALFSGVGRRGAIDEGVAAYQAGQRAAARLAFERAAADDPSDARPFVFLGRLAREEGDLVQARRLLEQAVERDPDYALAHRELASALLADGQPELARRFYVRALTLDPADQLAQGFLGCALARLGRIDEARRWLSRAGPGDWTACANAIPVPPTP